MQVSSDDRVSWHCTSGDYPGGNVSRAPNFNLKGRWFLEAKGKTIGQSLVNPSSLALSQ